MPTEEKWHRKGGWWFPVLLWGRSGETWGCQKIAEGLCKECMGWCGTRQDSGNSWDMVVFQIFHISSKKPSTLCCTWSGCWVVLICHQSWWITTHPDTAWKSLMLSENPGPLVWFLSPLSLNFHYKMKFWVLKQWWKLCGSPQDGRLWVAMWWTALIRLCWTIPGVCARGGCGREEVLSFAFIIAFLFFSPGNIPLCKDRSSHEVFLKNVSVEFPRNAEL